MRFRYLIKYPTRHVYDILDATSMEDAEQQARALHPEGDYAGAWPDTKEPLSPDRHALLLRFLASGDPVVKKLITARDGEEFDRIVAELGPEEVQRLNALADQEGGEEEVRVPWVYNWIAPLLRDIKSRCRQASSVEECLGIIDEVVYRYRNGATETGEPLLRPSSMRRQPIATTWM